MAIWLLSALMLTAVGDSDCTVLQFTASWCEPCKQMQPSIEQLEREGWRVQRVDTDQQPQWAEHYQVQNLPTLVILSGGEEVDRIVGVASYDQIQKRVARVAARGGQSSGGLTNSSAPQLRQAPHAPIVRGQSPGIQALPTLASNAVAVAQLAVSSSRNAPQPSTQDVVQRAAAATVRIRVDEGNTTAFGTGTIVDVHGEEALVLTCGHLFRDMKPGSQLTIDLFAGTPQEINVAAQLIDFQAEETDIGLISFRLPVRVEPVPIIPRGEQPQAGQPAFSFGCDHGQDPTRRDTRIRQINRYIGAANIEIAGAPAVGRSGGGLFDAQGRLIGVCNAADAEGDEGIYAAADVVYAQIERLNLAHLFENSQIASSSPPATNLAVAAQSASFTQAASPPPTFAQDSPDDRQFDSPALTPSFAMTPPSPETPGFHRGSQESSELICIVRSADGRDQVLTVRAPSAELLQSIQQVAEH